MTILLDDNDVGKIAQMVRQNKFRSSIEMIYTDKPEETIPNFLKAMRFLINIRNSISDENIKQKITDYLLQANRLQIREETIKIYEKYIISTPFNAHTKKRKALEFINSNRYVIEDTIDTVIPIGRVVKMINPDETAGYY